MEEGLILIQGYTMEKVWFRYNRLNSVTLKTPLGRTQAHSLSAGL